ncbi:hypothetical protein AX17_007148, partial [Amanita inopinata Kibby_2008]
MSTWDDKKGLPLSTTELLPVNAAPPSYSAKKSRVRSTLIALCLAACAFTFIQVAISDAVFPFNVNEDVDLCPQAEVLVPERNGELWNSVGETIGTDIFKTRAIDRLAGAVKVPTESYDDMAPVGRDPRWEVFSEFHDYLLGAFPQAHATLELTKVNTYGLLYVWKGQNASLKPVLLAAHQDVVPVDRSTWDSWNYPPFSGHYD